jgi:hypothetical protein
VCSSDLDLYYTEVEYGLLGLLFVLQQLWG